MKNIISCVIRLHLCILCHFTSAQVYDPVEWRFQSSKKEQNKVVLQAKIGLGWHLYSQHLDEGGPLPTVIEFHESNDYEVLNRTIEIPSPTRKYEEVFGIEVAYFEDTVTFIQEIKLLSEKAIVTGTIEYMVCKDQKCLPPDFKEFSIEVNRSNETKSVRKEVKALPKSNSPPPRSENDNQSDSLVNNKELVIEAISESDSLEITDRPDASIDETSQVELNQSKETSLWPFISLAFISGLLALLTPCVFPMIPLTVSFFSKKSRASGFFQAILFGLSIIIIYVIIGVLVSRLNGPGFANWLSTHWLPNIFFFLIFLIFALSFLGMFEIVLPSKWVNASDKKADKGGMIGVFFLAFTLALVSFSCTAPIVGNVLVLSAGGEMIKPIAGMFAFSLALALPFTLFAAFPGWLQSLPKSGGWLNSVKVVLGFLELALGLKFLSVADQVYHWGLLDRDVYLALWIVIFTLLGFYLLGKIRLPNDSILEKIPVPRFMFAMLTFSFVIYITPGLFGAPLKPLAGYLPPITTQDFNLFEASLRGGITNQPSEVCPAPKYADLLHLPHGLQGYFDLDQAIECAEAQNKPIFIDFTGHGCVNCREMEARVWSDPEVHKRLSEDYVIVALYVDEKTKLPENEWFESTFDGRLIKTVGRKNADYQITKFNNNAQPFYVLMDFNGNVLEAPKAYDLKIDSFIKFLDEGLKKFKQ